MISFKCLVTEIVNKKQKLTLAMIRKLNYRLKTPTEV